MFRRISYLIALQFTGFVFLLLLVNGSIFLAADFANIRRQTQAHLTENLQLMLDRSQFRADGMPAVLPPGMRERVRVVSALGFPLYTGSLFENIPFSPKGRLSYAQVEGERYAVLTAPIMTQEGALTGYIQIAQHDRFHSGDIPVRAMLYLFVSVLISALTFLVGLFFARRSLKPAEQMVERLEQFTQDASHELRTPLATLNSSLDLALRSRNYRDGILSAKEDVREISGLVERLLELARLDKLVLKKEPIDLSALVTETVEKHRLLAEEREVSITGDIAQKVTVHGDPSLIRQVLGNLLSNAVKFSKAEGGSITVRLTHKELSVVDDGIGIAADALPHIFDRFYQAESSRSNDGFGLGLALVKRVVDLHGWRISVKSEESKGTTFIVHLSR